MGNNMSYNRYFFTEGYMRLLHAQLQKLMSHHVVAVVAYSIAVWIIDAHVGAAASA